MNNRNLIFVSYYPGCCGQFIGGMCDILFNNRGIPGIKKTGEASRSFQRHAIGLENKLNAEYMFITTKPNWSTEEQILFDKLTDEWKIPELKGQNNYVITSHILAINELQSKFKNNKIILSIPKNQSEMDLAYKLWNIKNVNTPNFDRPIYDESGLASLTEQVDGKEEIMLLHLSDILNEEMIETNVNRLINHLNSTDEYKENAINFYKKYLKTQKLS